MPGQALSGPERRTIVLGFLAVWSVLVIVALANTLASLKSSDFDGLNNLFQIPFALPWFLLPLPALTGWSHETDAWVVAGMGLLNGVLLAHWINRGLRAAPDAVSTSAPRPRP